MKRWPGWSFAAGGEVPPYQPRPDDVPVIADAAMDTIWVTVHRRKVIRVGCRACGVSHDVTEEASLRDLIVWARRHHEAGE